MKKQIISAFSLCFISIFLLDSAYAQKQKSRMLPSVTITATSLPDRVMNSFTRSYTDASNVRWLLIEDRYLVKFDQNDMKHHALYLKGGSLVYHVGYGYEKNLPEDIRRMVRSSYDDDIYSMNRVFDVFQNDRQIWIVNLLNRKHIVTARIEDGNLQEVSRLKNNSVLSGNLTSMTKKNR